MRVFTVVSEQNIADWLTRGKEPNEIDLNNAWQKGPDFLKLPESEWPISRICAIQELPQEPRVVMIANTKPKDSLAVRIDISRYSDYTRLVRVTARVLAMFRTDYKPSFRNAARVLEPVDVTKAERFWILQAQETMLSDMKRGRFRRLCPRVREDGILVVGGRAEKWLEMSYNHLLVTDEPNLV